MRLTYVFTIFFLFLFSNSFSQDTAKVPRYGLAIEVGAGPFFENGALAFGRSTWVTVARDNVMYKLRIQYIREFMPIGASPEEYTRNFALMIGKKRGNDVVHAGASIGLGISRGVYRGEFIKNTGFLSTEYEQKTFSKVSLPMEVDVVFKPLEVVGFGLALTADLNAQKKTLGVMVKVGVGLF